MDEKKKAKLGQRWVCFSCSAAFYDLNKPEPICPKCQSNQLESPTVKQSRSKAKRTRKKASRKKAVRIPEPPTIDDAEGSDFSAEDDGVDFEELDLDGSDQIADVQVEDD